MSARAEPVYLDHAATTPVRPEAAAAVARALALTGNPSSVHAAGRAARAALETAREQVAALVGARAQDVIFTSGGTEANALALRSAARAGLRILYAATEHASVVAVAEALGGEALPVRPDGVIDLHHLHHALTSGPVLVAVQAANQETGVLQPIAEVAAAVRAAGGWLHVDAVQAAGKLPSGTWAMFADTLALSAHKLGGPQGVGALVDRSGRPQAAEALGGGQERGLRAGTQNLPGAVGFGAATALADPATYAAQAPWRDGAAARLRDAGAVLVAAEADRLPHVLCVAAPGWESMRQVMALDLAGVMVSAGSACSSGKVSRSPVLDAMGLDDLAPCSLRVSGGWTTSAADWMRFADAWLHALSQRQRRAA